MNFKKVNSRMLLYFFAAALVFAACKSGDIPCPEPKKVRARKVTVPRQVHMAEIPVSPNRYQVARERSIQKMREDQSEARAAKTPEAADEWDCPKPGANKRYSKVVKENIKKNKKKIKLYYKNRVEADSAFTFLQPQTPK